MYYHWTVLALMVLTGNQDTEESQQDGSDHGEPGPLREQVCRIMPYTSLSEWK